MGPLHVPPPPTMAWPQQRRRAPPTQPANYEQTGLGLPRLSRDHQRVISRHATSVLRSQRRRESPLRLDGDSSAAFTDLAAYILAQPDVASITPVLTEVDIWLVLRTSVKKGVGPRFRFSVGDGEPADFVARAHARVSAVHRPAAPTLGAAYYVSDEDSEPDPAEEAGAQGWHSAASTCPHERNVRPRRA